MSIHRGPRIVTNGLVLALDAGSTKSYPSSGTTWFDRSGNRNNGTLTNGPTFNSANGGTIVFDGTNDYVDCGNILASLTNLSLECFIKLGTQTTNYNGIISKTLDNTNGYEIRTTNYTSTTTDAAFRYVGDNASVGFGTLTNGVWYHLVATGTSGSQKVYINGALYSSGTVASTPSSNANALVIGKLAYSGLYANMSMGFARVYNRALSASEVLQNFNAQRYRFGI